MTGARSGHGGRNGPGLLHALALTARTVDEIVVDTVRDTHTVMAARVHAVVRATTTAGPAPQALHEAIAGTTFHTIGLGLRGAATGLSAAASLGVGPPLETGRGGRFFRGAVNGLYGDRLERERDPMAITMGVRVDGRDVPVEPASLAQAFPAATGRVAVFLHGLGESEASWSRGRDTVGATYAETLARLGWTPVLVRANSGLPLHDNGAGLSDLLDAVTGAWPVEMEQLVLVGHSMGGLIARAACAVRSGHAEGAWQGLVSDVVTLGTPHHGAPAARVAARGGELLSRRPETAPLGRVLDRRSAGIDDLRTGLGVEAPALEHVRYRLVSATVGAERAPVSRLIGDLLVHSGSARGEPWLFPDGDVLHLEDTHHFDLLNHPEVHEALERWLGPAAS